MAKEYWRPGFGSGESPWVESSWYEPQKNQETTLWLELHPALGVEDKALRGESMPHVAARPFQDLSLGGLFWNSPKWVSSLEVLGFSNLITGVRAVGQRHWHLDSWGLWMGLTYEHSRFGWDRPGLQELNLGAWQSQQRDSLALELGGCLDLSPATEIAVGVKGIRRLGFHDQLGLDSSKTPLWGRSLQLKGWGSQLNLQGEHQVSPRWGRLRLNLKGRSVVPDWQGQKDFAGLSTAEGTFEDWVLLESGSDKNLQGNLDWRGTGTHHFLGLTLHGHLAQVETWQEWERQPLSVDSDSAVVESRRYLRHRGEGFAGIFGQTRWQRSGFYFSNQVWIRGPLDSRAHELWDLAWDWDLFTKFPFSSDGWWLLAVEHSNSWLPLAGWRPSVGWSSSSWEWDLTLNSTQLRLSF